MESANQKAFRAVRKTRVSEEIVSQVRDLITSGRLKVGDRLPSERELAATLQVGRSTVREAMRVMESMGILQARPGEGTFLIANPLGQHPDPVAATAFKSWDNQHKLFEVRMVIEPDLAALAARRASLDQIAKMREIVQEQDAALKRGEVDMKADTAFHFLLAEATGNEVLVRIMDNLMSLLHETRAASMRIGDRAIRSLKQHKAILRTIEARDPAAAERRMREHIRGMEKLVFATQSFASASADDAAKPSPAPLAEIST